MNWLFVLSPRDRFHVMVSYPSEEVSCVESCRGFSTLSFYKKVSQYSRKIKEIIAKYWKDYFSQRKTENAVDKFFSESCLTPFSVRVHAFSINFFLIDRLNVALQNCFCRFSLRWNMRKLEEKQKGGRNLWNTLYM